MRNNPLFIQAMLNVAGAIPGQHPRFISLVDAFNQLDLLGTALFRSDAKLRGDLVGSTSFWAKLARNGIIRKTATENMQPINLMETSMLELMISSFVSGLAV